MPKRVPLHELTPETRGAIDALKKRLTDEGWILSAQITFDNIRTPKGRAHVVPSVDVRAILNPDVRPELKAVDDA